MTLLTFHESNDLAMSRAKLQLLLPLCQSGEDCNVTSGTQCNHLFHKHCIIKWMEKKDFCPFCRKDMMTVDEFEKAAQSVLDEKRFREAKEESESRAQVSTTGIAREDSLT